MAISDRSSVVINKPKAKKKKKPPQLPA